MKNIVGGASILLTACRVANERLLRRSRLAKHTRAERHFRDLLRLGLIEKPVAVTCAGRRDGPGAQLHAMLSTIAFCRACEIPYLHTPIRSAEHITSPDELRQWESFLDLERWNEVADLSASEIVDLRDFVRTPLAFRQYILAVESMHGFVNQQPSLYAPLSEQLMKQVAVNSSNDTTNAAIGVAVHIRRGDVSDNQNSNRFTGLDQIDRTLQSILETCEAFNMPCEVTVHSQGAPEDFSNLSACEPELDLNADPLRTLQALAQADILVTAKSSFSYLAALLSGGVVIYEPFWHQPMAHWLRADRDGRVRREDLNDALRELPSLRHFLSLLDSRI